MVLYHNVRNPLGLGLFLEYDASQWRKNICLWGQYYCFHGNFSWNYRIHTRGMIEFPWGGTDVRKCRLFIGPSWPGGVKGAGLSASRDQSKVRRPLHRQSNWLKRRPRCTGAAMRAWRVAAIGSVCWQTSRLIFVGARGFFSLLAYLGTLWYLFCTLIHLI